MPALTESQKTRAVSVLQELINIDSTNPSREESIRRRSEERIIDHLKSSCGRLGMEVRLQEVWPGRANLVAHWPDRGGTHGLAFEAHADTVGVDGMTLDPFSGDVRDGKVWGRGACDAKGSLAAFLVALEIAGQHQRRFGDRIHLVATVGEETGCEGAAAVLKGGFRVEACLVGEPPRCRLITAHKGALWFKLVARGVPCHTSMPHQGRNAIYAMARAVRFVEEQFSRNLEQVGHPLLGHPTIAVSTIHGGQALNIVAPRCEAGIDWRFLPGQPHAELVHRFECELKTALPVDADSLGLEDVEAYPGMEADANGSLVRNLLPLCRDATGQRSPEGVLYFADSGPFHQAGIQCVVFGPGSIAQAHKAEEYIELDQYFLAIEMVLSLLERYESRSVLD